MSYQGRTDLRHTHQFTYNDSQFGRFQWDKPEEKTGLK